MATINYFEACHYCKPPKRYPGCHDHCPDYLGPKAAYDEKRKQARLDKVSWSYINKNIADSKDAYVKHVKNGYKRRTGRRD